MKAFVITPIAKCEGMDVQTLHFVKKYTNLIVVNFDKCVCIPFHLIIGCWLHVHTLGSIYVREELETLLYLISASWQKCVMFTNRHIARKCACMGVLVCVYAWVNVCECVGVYTPVRAYACV